MKKKTQNYKKIWDDFWAEICLNPDGSINLDQIKRELADYSRMMDNTSRVFEEISGFVKPNTDAEYIIAAHEEKCQESYQEGFKDGQDEIEE